VKSFLLHLTPEILLTAAFLIFKPFLESTGYPPSLAFLLVVLLIDSPFMLGVLFYKEEKLNVGYSLEGVTLYRQKVSWKTFVLVFVGVSLGWFLLRSL
jgi:hypothetical protein